MKDLLSGAEEILRRLEEEGREAVLVGGMVRDLLCGLAPCDADIASDAPLPVLASLFPSGRLIGPEGMQVFLLPFGRLADIHGRKKVFSIGILFFLLGSLAAALSRSGGTTIGNTLSR